MLFYSDFFGTPACPTDNSFPHRANSQTITPKLSRITTTRTAHAAGIIIITIIITVSVTVVAPLVVLSRLKPSEY